MKIKVNNLDFQVSLLLLGFDCFEAIEEGKYLSEECSSHTQCFISFIQFLNFQKNKKLPEFLFDKEV